MVCLLLLEAGMSVCGLSAASSRDDSQSSVFGFYEQIWQSVVCLWLLIAGMIVSGLSLTAYSRDGNLWSVFGCL